MLSFRRSAMLLVAAAMMTEAQPALTTIEDILYRADGTRFNGEIFINWNAFQAGDTSNIATAQVKLPIVNGVLNVKLVPTTTASAGANYMVTYNSQGQFQFSQVWAVPPSSVVLRVKDVLVSEGTVVGPGGGPGPITNGPVQISDVVGLVNALALAAQKGVGFALGRTAVINTSGQIDGASGNLGDCVRVDGSSSPCGGSNGGSLLPLYSDGETPSGAINGVNTTFFLAFAPSPVASLQLYHNGLLMEQGVDYTVSGTTITFNLASLPQAGDLLLAEYRYGNPNNPLGSLTAPQVVCSAVGTGTSNTSSTTLGTCTLPAGLLGSGDRIEIRYQFLHQGTATGFTPQIGWAGAPILSRSGAAADTAYVGRLEFAINSSAQPWNGQSWGSSLAFATAVGSASANTTQSLTISFLGQMSGAGSDSVSLSSFTVVRYPAQVNP
jgi:hypothetical protein